MTQASPIPQRRADDGDPAVALLPFAPNHLERAVALSSEMNWPYRLEDWAFAAGIGQGFALERADALIGTAMWWPYGPHFASAGMIIIAGSEQGRGYGARLFDRLLAAAAPRSVMLNATAEGLPLYVRRGFVEVGTIHQHQGILLAQPFRVAGPAFRRARPADFSSIAKLDRDATGLSRPRLFERLWAEGEAVVVERDGAIRGFAIVRTFGRGEAIGPVVAPDESDARTLVETLLQGRSGRFVRLDVPATSGLGPWLADRGIVRVGEAVSMVRGEAPAIGNRATTFAIANQSFG